MAFAPHNRAVIANPRSRPLLASRDGRIRGTGGWEYGGYGYGPSISSGGRAVSSAGGGVLSSRGRGIAEFERGSSLGGRGPVNSYSVRDEAMQAVDMEVRENFSNVPEHRLPWRTSGNVGNSAPPGGTGGRDEQDYGRFGAPADGGAEGEDEPYRSASDGVPRDGSAREAERGHRLHRSASPPSRATAAGTVMQPSIPIRVMPGMTADELLDLHRKMQYPQHHPSASSSANPLRAPAHLSGPNVQVGRIRAPAHLSGPNVQVEYVRVFFTVCYGEDTVEVVTRRPFKSGGPRRMNGLVVGDVSSVVFHRTK